MDFTAQAWKLVDQMTLEEAAEQLKFDAPPVDQLGIPRYHWWSEALHGVARAGTATMFPQAIGMAAMFDTPMMQEIGDIISTEARAKYNAAAAEGDRSIYKGLTLWSPNVNIFRDPRWGRGQETYGEDPFLTARIGVAYIKGVQGNGKYLKAAACAKHFAVHSGPEELRHEFNAVVSQKDLWETYLPAFEACVREGHVEGVMGAYNRVNGEPCCGSRTLMKDILRGQWGFDGYYTSDCWALKDFHMYHGVTNTATESAALALKMGCDINCGNIYLKIMQAYQEGLVTEEDIRTSAMRAMRTRLRLGMFADDCEYDQISYDEVASQEHRRTAVRAAEKSAVLLKNEEYLPLNKKIGKLAVIGPNADSRLALIGNYHGVAPKYITVLEGIDMVTSDETRIYYAQGCDVMKDRVEELALPDDYISEAAAVARIADTAIVCIGLDERYEGEQQDDGNQIDMEAIADKETIRIPDAQLRMLEAVLATGADVVIVNMTGSAIALDELDRADNVKAILQGWYPGAEGGLAIARILFGDVNPSGKLPVTFYDEATKLPSMTEYAMKNRTYRYMEDQALYPFGYGLSYTSFVYSNAETQELPEGGMAVTVDITNGGACDGEEVAEVYLRDEDSEFEVRNQKLCGFERVSLAQGETKRVRIELPESSFCIVDDQGRQRRDGTHYSLYVGGSQPDPRSVRLLGRAPLKLKIVKEA